MLNNVYSHFQGCNLIVNTALRIPIISNNFFWVQAVWWSEGQRDRAVPWLDKCTHKFKLPAAHQIFTLCRNSSELNIKLSATAICLPTSSCARTLMKNAHIESAHTFRMLFKNMNKYLWTIFTSKICENLLFNNISHYLQERDDLSTQEISVIVVEDGWSLTGGSLLGSANLTCANN